MSDKLTKQQMVIMLRNGGVAYIDTPEDGIETFTKILDTQKYLKVSETRIINTVDITQILSPFEFEKERRFQRGDYIRFGEWYDKKGENLEWTVEKYNAFEELKRKASDTIKEFKEKGTYDNKTIEELIEFSKANDIRKKDIEYRNGSVLVEIINKHQNEKSNKDKIDTKGLADKMKA